MDKILKALMDHGLTLEIIPNEEDGYIVVKLSKEVCNIKLHTQRRITKEFVNYTDNLISQFILQGIIIFIETMNSKEGFTKFNTSDNLLKDLFIKKGRGIT